MSTVRLYLASAGSWSETEVGRLVDGQVEVGQGPSTTYPARVDADGTVMFGSKATYGPAQTVLGHVNEQDRTVSEGLSRYGDAIGAWDDDGTVYGGPFYRREKIGRCDPSPGPGAACLLLLFAEGAPHREAIVAATQEGSAFNGLEVKLPKQRKPPDPGHDAAVAVGVATGAATLAAEGFLGRWWRSRKATQFARRSPERTQGPAPTAAPDSSEPSATGESLGPN